jgi:hypothetical protein
VLVHNVSCPTGVPGPSEYQPELNNNRPVQQYDTVPYRPTVPGFENHHGIMDAWLKNNVSGYVSRAGDSTTMTLSAANHGVSIHGVP